MPLTAVEFAGSFCFSSYYVCCSRGAIGYSLQTKHSITWIMRLLLGPLKIGTTTSSYTFRILFVRPLAVPPPLLFTVFKSREVCQPSGFWSALSFAIWLRHRGIWWRISFLYYQSLVSLKSLIAIKETYLKNLFSKNFNVENSDSKTHDSDF